MSDETKNGFIRMVAHEFFQNIYITVKDELGSSNEEEIMNAVRDVVNTMDHYVELTLERIRLSKEASKDVDKHKKTPDIGDDFGI